ncbi:MAG: pilus assembly protein [Alphaproteobacteria bacterium]|nr:pilus assembly protein [Alphaproteobacteria bacterium]
MFKLLRSFRRDRRGLAAVEFALILSILTTLVVGVLEVGMKILAAQKAENLASTTADVVAQSETATLAGLDQILDATDDVMAPFDFGADGRVIITSIYRAPDTLNATINWQHTGGGSLVATSRIGSTGQTPTNLPEGFVLNERENVIVAEVYYRYQPLLPGLMFEEATLYRRALFKPRLGTLTTPPT